MSITIAIHNKKGSFSDRWINYCNTHGINYKIVNCLDSDIIQQLKNVDGVTWHWMLDEPAAQLAARQIIASIEEMGKKVFPSRNSCWHYDDKIGQKYLLESIGAPVVPTYVFWDKKEAIDWINESDFPKVFKLRCGASSNNVRLVKTKTEAKKLCRIAFGKGFKAQQSYFVDARIKLRRIQNSNQLLQKVKRIPKSIKNIYHNKKFLQIQKGYIYFQDFLSNNKYDTRITVIGQRAFGSMREVRLNDFRASGSGKNYFNRELIDTRFIKIAQQVTNKLKAQSLAFDFIFDSNKEPKITEISYCYPSYSIYNCPGYWDEKLNWHEGHVFPEDAILEDLIKEIYTE